MLGLIGRANAVVVPVPARHLGVLFPPLPGQLEQLVAEAAEPLPQLGPSLGA
jgi:hypothetical protein